jgi:hypothetical protein
VHSVGQGTTNKGCHDTNDSHSLAYALTDTFVSRRKRIRQQLHRSERPIAGKTELQASTALQIETGTMQRALQQRSSQAPFRSFSATTQRSSRTLVVRCRAQAAATADKAKLFEELKESCAAFKKAPPSMVGDIANNHVRTVVYCSQQQRRRSCPPCTTSVVTCWGVCNCQQILPASLLCTNRHCTHYHVTVPPMSSKGC